MAEDRSVLARAGRGPGRSTPYGDDRDQVIDLYAPAAAQPRRIPIVLVHGGFWRAEYDRDHLRPMAAALADRGHSVALIEYRRRPGDPDTTVADVRSAIASAHASLGDPAVVVGHSAGGHLVLLAAASPVVALAGCVALAPVADLGLAEELALDGDAVRAFLGGAAASRPDLDPVLRPPAIPTTVVHGQDDSLVPVALGSTYCTSTGARLVPIPGLAHFELIDPLSPAWPVVLAELDALVAAAGTE